MRIQPIFCLCICLSFQAGISERSLAASLQQVPSLQQGPLAKSLVQPVSDTCWWWGTRWQYGWRGYGWYTCWDEAKPFPTQISPEAIPQEALVPESCVKTWRDRTGKQRSRTVC
jgi:hypothetical protein